MITFTKCPTDLDGFYLQDSAREEIEDLRAAVAYTPYQQVFKLVAFKSLLEQREGHPVTNARAATILKSNVTQSASSEPMSESFIREALDVFTKGFKFPEVVALVKLADHLWGLQGPWSGVSTLHKYVAKTQEKSIMVWLFASTVDGMRAGLFTQADFSNRKLTPQTGNKKGVMDFFIAKFRLKSYLLSSWLDKQQSKHLPDHIKLHLRSKLANHETYREQVLPLSDDDVGNHEDLGDTDVGPAGGSESIRLQWKCGWKMSWEMVLDFLSTAIYGTDLDPSIKNSVKNRKSVEEMMEYQQFKERISPITEQFERESAT